MVSRREKKKCIRRFEMGVLKDLAREVTEAGLVAAFKDYLVERFYMEHTKDAMPDSVLEICRMLAVGHYRWGLSDTLEYLYDFTTKIQTSAVPAHDWQTEGF